ncbi:hypothetical protein [Streptomyces misionensis]|uniref:hypothetical protein n=1 Tax=Streptomyces misionensis TaxID=67331 RepID=UPI003BAE4994
MAELESAKNDIERGRWVPTKAEQRVAREIAETGPPYDVIPDSLKSINTESRFSAAVQAATHIFQLPPIHEEPESRERLQLAFESFLRAVSDLP